MSKHVSGQAQSVPASQLAEHVQTLFTQLQRPAAAVDPPHAKVLPHATGD